ncbi:preprotein translocase subunit SecG [Vineibacter terrae]|uniref:preprotein translocase subunit SecG n=1 Tax=Vineibacter terrae TaxID=2586908 RepID=UPI002E375B3E|nr:preprotein translocase subunit SecG [Vineibacter terrae]HEX2887749.1 preprotein translocase subunit SecG [Vineibacter terrae]
MLAIQNVVLAIHVLIAVSLVVVVLLQRSEGGGLGMGRSDSFMSTRGQANLLTRTTAILAGTFFATSIALAILAGTHSKPSSIMDQGKPPAGQSAPAGTPSTGAPAAPAAPSTPTR